MSFRGCKGQAGAAIGCAVAGDAGLGQTRVEGGLMRATIKDVSRLAGVSIKTVSRVLNNERYVGTATRERVLQAVAALDFRPSAAARTLAGRRSWQIALICDNPNPYYVYEMQSGIRDRCEADGVRMIAQPYDRESPRLLEDIAALIDGTGVDGLILTPPVSDHPLVLELLARRNVRFVRVSPGTEPDLVSSTFIDNIGAAAAMTAHLVALGHRRIAFVAGHRSYATSGQRMSGYLSALQAAGIAIDLALVRQGDFGFESGAQACESLLAADDPPTAVFASSDTMAAGAVQAAHRLGVAIPHRLSIAGFDDTALASFTWPPLTTIRQPIRRLAHEAADLLLAGAPGTVEARELPFELVVRQSTGMTTH
jgi:LacI family transcriptional regulator